MKPDNYIDVQIQNMQSPDVISAELAGEIKLLRSQMENLANNFNEKVSHLSINVSDKLEELTKRFDQILANQEEYVRKEDFKKFQEENLPRLKWVGDRMAVEKFWLAFISVTNISTIIMVIKILIENAK